MWGVRFADLHLFPKYPMKIKTGVGGGGLNRNLREI